MTFAHTNLYGAAATTQSLLGFRADAHIPRIIARLVRQILRDRRAAMMSFVLGMC